MFKKKRLNELGSILRINSIIVAGVFGSLVCHGQTGPRYFDANGNQVEKSASYYYTDKVVSSNDTIRTYYTKGDVLRSVKPTNEKGRTDGVALFYHETGSIKSKANYAGGSLEGTVLSYYPNGSKQSEELFSSEGDSKLINYWDSLGVQIVKEGNGFCKCIFNIIGESNTLEAGKLENSLRDSIWVGYKKDGLSHFEELYQKGKLINGTLFDKTGEEYKYIVIEESAKPIDGFERMYQYINSKMTYPKEARKRGIEGKVYVEFVVEKDGSITNVRTLKGIGGGCDEVAVNAVASLPSWNAGLQRGKPVKQRMVLPLTFKLN